MTLQTLIEILISFNWRKSFQIAPEVVPKMVDFVDGDVELKIELKSYQDLEFEVYKVLLQQVFHFFETLYRLPSRLLPMSEIKMNELLVAHWTIVNFACNIEAQGGQHEPVERGKRVLFSVKMEN